MKSEFKLKTELERRFRFSSDQMEETRKEEKKLAKRCQHLEEAHNKRFFVYIPCLNSTIVDKISISSRKNPVAEWYLDEVAQVSCHHLHFVFWGGRMEIFHQEARKWRVGSFSNPPSEKYPRIE